MMIQQSNCFIVVERLVVVGEQKNGYINVQGAAASGWVKVVPVMRP
jgi:hypothetical protein